MESTPTTAKKKVAADRHPLAVAFGEYLKAVRKERDKSQAELAFDASMDRTYISLLERGLSAPTLLVLDSLAKSLGLTMTDLRAPLKTHDFRADDASNRDRVLVAPIF